MVFPRREWKGAPLPSKRKTWRARTFVTADGRTAYGEDLQVTVTLKGRHLLVQAIAVSHLDALGVDCLLGVDVIDQMRV